MAKEQKKAKKQQQPRKTRSGEWLYCNFSARPEEIEEWKAMAAAADRSLSWWIRDILSRWVKNVTGGHSNENDHGKPKAVDVAQVSTDRTRSDHQA